MKVHELQAALSALPRDLNVTLWLDATRVQLTHVDDYFIDQGFVELTGEYHEDDFGDEDRANAALSCDHYRGP